MRDPQNILSKPKKDRDIIKVVSKSKAVASQIGKRKLIDAYLKEEPESEF